MTRLRKTSEISEHTYVNVKEIISVCTEGNTTHLEIEVSDVVDQNGNLIKIGNVIVEIETLELVQTFNSTWTTHALSKLRSWLNQIVK
tara:strand:+ start:131 stop:394 length:264 start_codon:yes stop_codon:yes gene_type:complete